MIHALFAGKNVEFWRDMTVITQDELQTLKKLSAEGVRTTCFCHYPYCIFIYGTHGLKMRHRKTKFLRHALPFMC